MVIQCHVGTVTRLRALGDKTNVNKGSPSKHVCSRSYGLPLVILDESIWWYLGVFSMSLEVDHFVMVWWCAGLWQYPILTDLHWLPIKARIQCKTILLPFNMFKAVYGSAPHFISELVLVAPYTVSQIFHPATPKGSPTEGQNYLWWNDFCLQCPNHLELTLSCPPLTIKIMKRQLKTHFCKKCFMLAISMVNISCICNLISQMGITFHIMFSV